jgi:hypothetical protein
MQRSETAWLLNFAFHFHGIPSQRTEWRRPARGSSLCSDRAPAIGGRRRPRSWPRLERRVEAVERSTAWGAADAIQSIARQLLEAWAWRAR